MFIYCIASLIKLLCTVPKLICFTISTFLTYKWFNSYQFWCDIRQLVAYSYVIFEKLQSQCRCLDFHPTENHDNRLSISCWNLWWWAYKQTLFLGTLYIFGVVCVITIVELLSSNCCSVEKQIAESRSGANAEWFKGENVSLPPFCTSEVHLLLLCILKCTTIRN